MKKINRRTFLKAGAAATAATALVACGQDDAGGTTLRIAFVPSKDPDEIITATEPLENLLKEELFALGIAVDAVQITVGTSYEAVGEALSAGTADVGFIPGSTYVLYEEDVTVILTATRDGINKDSENPADWNDGTPTEATDEQVLFYRALLIAGPSAQGALLGDIINSGQTPTWQDLSDARWGVMSTTSPAGYVYPTLWLMEHYGKTITDLATVVSCDSYGTAFARLATGQLDVIAVYADARRDFQTAWVNDYARANTIWQETNVIGVTPGIYNDTVCVSKAASGMEEEKIEALQTAFINIGNTQEGKEIIAIYSHNGYQLASEAAYDDERIAQEIIRSMNEG